MVFKLEEIVNNLADLITDNEYLQSPLWVALIIVIIIVIIAWYVLHSEVDTIYEDTSMMHLYAKIGVLTFFTSGILIFLHNRSINKIYEKKNKSEQASAITTAIQQQSSLLPQIPIKTT